MPDKGDPILNKIEPTKNNTTLIRDHSNLERVDFEHLTAALYWYPRQDKRDGVQPEDLYTLTMLREFLLSISVRSLTTRFIYPDLHSVLDEVPLKNIKANLGAIDLEARRILGKGFASFYLSELYRRYKLSFNTQVQYFRGRTEQDLLANEALLNQIHPSEEISPIIVRRKLGLRVQEGKMLKRMLTPDGLLVVIGSSEVFGELFKRIIPQIGIIYLRAKDKNNRYTDLAPWKQ